jgi:hypothetical protein
MSGLVADASIASKRADDLSRDCAVATADRKFAASLAGTPFADRVRPLGAN